MLPLTELRAIDFGTHWNQPAPKPDHRPETKPFQIERPKTWVPFGAARKFDTDTFERAFINLEETPQAKDLLTQMVDNYLHIWM